MGTFGLLGDVIQASGERSNVPMLPDRGWFPVVHESFPGAWQRNIELRQESIVSFHAVYACITLIAADVSKVRIRMMRRDNATGIWSEHGSREPFSRALYRPNRYQDRIKFIEQWVVSKLIHGNTYVLKERDGNGIVKSLYILDAPRTRPMVAPDGSVYYQIGTDNLSGVDAQVSVPASEIIHDVMVPLYHPLCGVSPLTACGTAAAVGINIQHEEARFFANGARPSGILTTPSFIPQKEADEMKARWEQNYGGVNTGRVAILGGGLEYKAMSMSAHDAQLIEQLKWSAETVCSCFHVPGYMVGIGAQPTHNNIEALNQQYYSQCLQKLIESIELLLDEGLELPTEVDKTYGTEFDLDDLLRMDTATKADVVSKLAGGGIMKIDEARKKFDMMPTDGGDDCYLQQQNYSLKALAKRDARDDPFAKAPSTNDNQSGSTAPTPGGRNFLALALAAREFARDSAHAGYARP